MKLFLYDKFLDAFSKLPKAIQKKTTEFLKKFRENPTAHAINFEKIHSFIDQNLRTVRIDLAYRAVLYVSAESNVYHLLWVDHHDEAIQWANNKKFNWNRETQSYELYDLITEPINNPIQELTKTKIFEYIEDDKLLKIGVPDNLINQIKSISGIEDLELLETRLPEIAFENVFAVFDGVPIDSVIERVNEGKINSLDLTEQELSPNNKRNFHLITDDKELDKLLSGDFDKWKIFLHPSQYLIAFKDYNGSIKVSGAAGTGKTIAAIHRAKFLTDKITQNDKPLLFTTFTVALVENIKSIFKTLNFDFNKIQINNFHSFACNYAKENNLVPNNMQILDVLESVEEKLWKEITDNNITKFGLDFLKDEFKNVILFNNINHENDYLTTPRRGRTTKLSRKDKIDIWNLCEKFKQAKESYAYYYFDEITNIVNNSIDEKIMDFPFSYIICDELQDFSNIELKLLRKLAPVRANDLSLFGDPLQNIYNKRIVFSELNINIRGNRSKRLLLNYRTTEEIRRKAFRILKGENFNDFDNNNEFKSGYLSLIHGSNPVYKTFSTFEDELNYIKNKIDELILVQSNLDIQYNEICIASRRNDTLKDITSFLHLFKIPYSDMKSKKSSNQNGIRLASFHNIKGLEFKIVFLTGLNKNNFPLLPRNFQYLSNIKKEEYLKSEKSLIYVAMTRARDLLFITGTGDVNDLLRENIE